MIDNLKKLKLAEFYLKKFSKGKSSTDAAKAVDLSRSTIKRYKKDLVIKSERKITRKTREEKNQIYMKGVVTKLRNKQIKEEFDNINKNNDLTNKEKAQKLDEIRKKYNVNTTDAKHSNKSKPIKNNKSNKRIKESELDNEGKGKEEISDRITRILNNLNNNNLLKSNTSVYTADDEGFYNFINGTG